MSAQLASRTLIYRELVQPLRWGLQHSMWIRYHDNVLFLMKKLPGPNLGVSYEEYRQELKILTSMQITVEQVGNTIRFVECQLSHPLSQHSTALPEFLMLQEKPSSPPYIRKLKDGRCER